MFLKPPAEEAPAATFNIWQSHRLQEPALQKGSAGQQHKMVSGFHSPNVQNGRVIPSLRPNPACLICSWHLSPDDPPAIKQLVDDFNGITLLEGQLVLLHGCIAFLDNVLLTCAQNQDSGLCATTPGMGLSLSSH